MLLATCSTQLCRISAEHLTYDDLHALLTEKEKADEQAHQSQMQELEAKIEEQVQCASMFECLTRISQRKHVHELTMKLGDEKVSIVKNCSHSADEETTRRAT